MGKKVLIVEDESILAFTLKRIVEKEGYEVAGIVDYGEEVMAAVGKSSPDLAIVDIFLKGAMSGIEVVRAINEAYPSLPVIYATGNTDEATYESAMKTKHLAYLEKPVHRAELVALMKSALA